MPNKTLVISLMFFSLLFFCKDGYAAYETDDDSSEVAFVNDEPVSRTIRCVALGIIGLFYYQRFMDWARQHGYDH